MKYKLKSIFLYKLIIFLAIITLMASCKPKSNRQEETNMNPVQEKQVALSDSNDINPGLSDGKQKTDSTVPDQSSDAQKQEPPAPNQTSDVQKPEPPAPNQPSDVQTSVTAKPEKEPDQNTAANDTTKEPGTSASENKQPNTPGVSPVPETEPDKEHAPDPENQDNSKSQNEQKTNTTDSSSSSILSKDLAKDRFSLLDGRLFIQMPDGTKDRAIQESIMSAARSNQVDTMLILEENEESMVVYAQEMFLYAGDKFEDDADQIYQSQYGEGVRYEKEAINQSDSGFQVIKITPGNFPARSGMIEVSQAYVKTTDNLVITIGVYVTPEMQNEKELLLKQTDKILASLQPGTRTLNILPHEEMIDNNISIFLDKDYVLIEESGIDFSVYYIVKITKIDEISPSIGIYIGAHPSPLYYGRGIEDNELTVINDKILSQNVDWVSYKPNQDDDFYCAETILPLSGKPFVLHIFIDAANEEEFERIKEMIHTLKYK